VDGKGRDTLVINPAAAMDLYSFVLTIVAGLLLVFAGRKFFWLAAGVIAFLFSFPFFQQTLGGGWIGVVLALLMGAICAWLAILFIRTIGYIIGAFAGAAGLPIFLGMFGIQGNWILLALIGLLLGIILVKFAFNWGLILMTVWVGSYAMTSKISTWLALNTRLTMWIFITLLGAGVIVQATQLRRKH
jgi:hypothetical protein